MVSKLMLAIKLVTAVHRFLREVESDAKARLSDERARADRLKLESTLWKLYSGRDTGWRKYVSVDDQLLRYAQIVLKSAKLDAVTNGGSKPYGEAISAFRGVQ